ncbi:uncharacterized protein LOC132040119 [Lycium ferocissimum]|uniref:uncharacterized protein LOC132040119 n=1 Tax=Lycium ferocissimum TaxID=112874 RepID=UPI002814AB72|nr:uncharacterized protein LOC132040119 [Lycium ferocissimum]
MAIPKSILLIIIGFVGTLFSIVLATPQTATVYTNIAPGNGNSNLAPMEMVKKLELTNRCGGNLGPCDHICDKECCIETCNRLYKGRNPTPGCKHYGTGFLSCICTYDC